MVRGAADASSAMAAGMVGKARAVAADACGHEEHTFEETM